MSSNESLSSTILSNVANIADIYKIVKEAGLKATQSAAVKASEENVKFIRPGIKGVNRSTAECRAPIPDGPSPNVKRCRQSHAYSIKYDANDIVIVGGAALNIYDYLLRELKARRDIAALEEYLKKKTSDIDIVWWPRDPTEKEIIISSSDAIEAMAIAFKQELVKLFDEKREELEAKLKPYIGDAKLSINVKLLHMWAVGVWSINIEFVVGDKVLKICDISLHDSGSSQLIDKDGRPITDLSFMTSDPIYSSPRQGQSNSISYLNVDGVDIGVPSIESFVKQQMLAFNNLIRRKEDKAFINYKRVEFIKKLLQSLILNNANTQNKKELMEVFKTDNVNYPVRVINMIDNQEKESVNKLRNMIIPLCKANNSNEFSKELCEKASIPVKDRYLSQILPVIDMIKERLRQKSKDDKTTGQIRREYSDLFRAVDNFRVKLLRMPAMEVVVLSSGPSPVQPFLDKENEMDVVVQKLFANRQAEETRKAEEAKRAEEFRMAQEQQRRAEKQYRESMAVAARSHPQIHITHYPLGMAPPLPPGASWTPAPIIPLPHNRPPPPVYFDSRAGQHWYTHPITGQIIVQDPATSRWYPRDLPSVPISYQPPLPPGPPPKKRGFGGTLRKGVKRNMTRRN